MILSFDYDNNPDTDQSHITFFLSTNIQTKYSFFVPGHPKRHPEKYI